MRILILQSLDRAGDGDRVGRVVAAPSRDGRELRRPRAARRGNDSDGSHHGSLQMRMKHDWQITLAKRRCMNFARERPQVRHQLPAISQRNL